MSEEGQYIRSLDITADWDHHVAVADKSKIVKKHSAHPDAYARIKGSQSEDTGVIRPIQREDPYGSGYSDWTRYDGPYTRQYEAMMVGAKSSPADDTRDVEMKKIFRGTDYLWKSGTNSPNKIADDAEFCCDQNTDDVGIEGKNLKARGCSVSFPAGSVKTTQKISINSDLNPRKWPEGKLAITPMLTINVAPKSLLIPANVQLSTWCRPICELECIADVLWLNDDTHSWEMIHSCGFGVSRVIEFETTRSGSMIAVCRRSGDLEHAISCIFYHWRNIFAVSVMLDTPLAVMRSRQMTEKLIHTDVQEFPLDVVYFEQSDLINILFKICRSKRIITYTQHRTTMKSILRMGISTNISTFDETATLIEILHMTDKGGYQDIKARARFRWDECLLPNNKWSSFEPLLSSEGDAGFPSDHVTVEIGHEENSITVGGCSVIFPQGCFAKTQQICVTTEMNPSSWPAGKIGITPTLTIASLSTFKFPVKVELSTWCRQPDNTNSHRSADVLCFNETTADWDCIHSCPLGTSGTIDFETKHAGPMLAVTRVNRFLTLAIIPIFYHWRDIFAVAVTLYTPLATRHCRRVMEKRIHTNVKELTLPVLFCNEDDLIETFFVSSFEPVRRTLRSMSRHTHDVKRIMRSMETSISISSFDDTTHSVEFRYRRTDKFECRYILMDHFISGSFSSFERWLDYGWNFPGRTGRKIKCVSDNTSLATGSIKKLPSDIRIYDDFRLEPEFSDEVYYGYQFLSNGKKRDLAVRFLRNVHPKAPLHSAMITDHPNIAKIVAFGNLTEQPSMTYIATEPLLLSMQAYTECEKRNLNRAFNFFQQIVSAVVYLHENAITDILLSPRNILMANDGTSVKVSVIEKYTKLPSGGKGKWYWSFMAPESLESTSISIEEYDKTIYRGLQSVVEHDVQPSKRSQSEQSSADVFSLGVNGFYIMTHGIHPFSRHALSLKNDRTLSTLFHDMIVIITQAPEFPESEQTCNLINLICRMLNTDQHLRPTARLLQKDQFFSDLSTVSRKKLNGDGRKIARIVSCCHQIIQASDAIDLSAVLSSASTELDAENEQKYLWRLFNLIPEDLTANTVTKIATNLGRQRYFIQAIVLYRVAVNLIVTRKYSAHDVLPSIANCVIGIADISGKLPYKENHHVAGKYAFKYMVENLHDMRAATDANDDAKTLLETSCLVRISNLSIKLPAFMKMISICKDAVDTMQRQFGEKTCEHRQYVQLLNNVGEALEYYSKRHEAEKYYQRALQATLTASYENELKVEDIRTVRANLDHNKRKIKASEYYRKFVMPQIREQSTLTTLESDRDEHFQILSRNEDCNRLLCDEVTEYIGPEGKTVEIDGCIIGFPAGCFDQTQQVSIKADIDPTTWPRGRVGITPTLHIEAPVLKVPATMKLTTWCISDANDKTPKVDVLRFNRDKNDWEFVHTCPLGTRRNVEFQIDHFSDILGTIKKLFLGIHVLLPIVYHNGHRFAVTTTFDNKTARRECLKKISRELGDAATPHEYDTFHCKTSNSIRSKLDCATHPDTFTFITTEYEHPVTEVNEAGGSRVDFTTLVSSGNASEVTMRFQLFKDDKLKRHGTFPYHWKPCGTSSKELRIVQTGAQGPTVSTNTPTNVNVTLNLGAKTANTIVEGGGQYESENRNCEVHVTAPSQSSAI